MAQDRSGRFCPPLPSSRQGAMEAGKAPVKNTFIHFDEAAERPAKRSRASSAPPDVRAEPSKEEPPSTVKAADLSRDDAGGGEGQKMEKKAEAKPTVKWADVEDEPQDTGAAKTSRKQSHSRSRSRSVRRGAAPKELSGEERHEKRFGYVSAVKETEGYKAYLKNRDAGDDKAVSAPRTPDPNQDCSKRSWEGQILAWRTSLREWGTVTVVGDKESST